MVAEKSGFQVIEDKINSIALKGFYKPSDDTITINRLLADSEKLSTMTHEFAHSLMHKTSSHPGPVAEFEAECLSHMIQRRLGLPLSDMNKNYLATYYSKIKENELQLENSFKRISKAYNHATEGIDRELKERGIEVCRDHSMKQKHARQPAEKVNANFLQNIDQEVI